MFLPVLILAVFALTSGSVIKPQIVRSISGCSIGANGVRFYNGTHARSKFQSECLPWSELQTVYPEIISDPNFFEDESIKDAKNYCRNPNMNADGPWCYVQGDEELAMESCDLCQSLALTTPATTTKVTTNEQPTVTMANPSQSLWDRLRDEIYRVGAYIRERLAELVARIKGKF